MLFFVGGGEKEREGAAGRTPPVVCHHRVREREVLAHEYVLRVPPISCVRAPRARAGPVCARAQHCFQRRRALRRPMAVPELCVCVYLERDRKKSHLLFERRVSWASARLAGGRARLPASRATKRRCSGPASQDAFGSFRACDAHEIKTGKERPASHAHARRDDPRGGLLGAAVAVELVVGRLARQLHEGPLHAADWCTWW